MLSHTPLLYSILSSKSLLFDRILRLKSALIHKVEHALEADIPVQEFL